ncbi:transglycosylase domain-containing protein [Cellulomonas soli]|uniref:transglycosylase domain-containing protein n=1 Tax=Cellulomonas soli TaxID=931535 RepID=UPI003F864F01
MAGTNRRAQPAPPRRSTRSGSRARQPEPKGKRRFFDYPRSGYKGLHRWLPSWRFMLGSFLTGVFLVAGALVAAYAKVQPPLPSAEIFSETTTVYYADTLNADGSTTPGAVMGTFAEQKREIVDFSTLPEYVGNAVVASEDRTFFTNSGVDIKGIGRALLNNVSGGDTQGASTLTQQYVERYYVNKTTSDYLGKFNEALLAVKISRQESKDEILSRYLNTIYFGRDSYGIQAAAQSYFGVNAADLTLSQAAVLAGIIPSPNNWDPAVKPDKAEQRWNRVLDIMVEDGWITAAERAEQQFPPVIQYTRSETYRGPVGYLLTMVRDELIAKVPSMTDEKLNRGGYTIHTTIQQPVQAAAEAAVTQLWDGTLADGAVPNERMKVAVASVDPADGAIVALYGGKDYLEDAINRATYGDGVQAGSTFKPFALVAGLEAGIPLTKTYDGSSPQTFGDWTVKNFDNTDYGSIDLVKSTAQSVNTVYAQLNIEVGPEKTADVATRAGITTPVESNRANVLGTTGVHPLDMAAAYATFAAQGWQADPFIVRSMTNTDDTLAYQGGEERSQQFQADVMADATYAMTQVVEVGSGKQWVQPLGKPVAGKTGTSTENKSAWFVGYTPTLATAVAFSQVAEDGKSQDTITAFGKRANGRDITEITGGTWPSALWAAYMGPVLDMPQFAKVTEFPARANIKSTATPTPTVTETPVEVPTEPPAPVQVAVPSNLVDKLEADATAAILAAGLSPVVTSEYSDTVTKGRVIRTDPGSGTSVDTGTGVSLVISLGPKPVETPAPQPTPTPSATPAAAVPGAP